MNANKIRAVIDTQLFLRATANLNSLPAKIIYDLQNRYELVASDAVIAEVRDVLNRPAIRAKFLKITDELVERALGVLERSLIVSPTETLIVSRDPKDDKFLECAKAADAQFIVSEDKDLLVLNPYESIQIVDALTFFRILQNSE